MLLFLSFLSHLLYTFLFSRILCTHFAIFGLLSRADNLNRTEERTDVLLVENWQCVVVIALDLVFRYNIGITWLTFWRHDGARLEDIDMDRERESLVRRRGGHRASLTNLKKKAAIAIAENDMTLIRELLRVVDNKRQKLATKMKENTTRKMAPGSCPKSFATGTEKIFRALKIRGITPQNSISVHRWTNMPNTVSGVAIPRNLRFKNSRHNCRNCSGTSTAHFSAALASRLRKLHASLSQPQTGLSLVSRPNQLDTARFVISQGAGGPHLLDGSSKLAQLHPLPSADPGHVDSPFLPAPSSEDHTSPASR